MGKATYAVDRPRFYALVISSTTGYVYLIPDIEQMETQKSDDGSAGTWSFTTPLINEYTIPGGSVYPRTIPYAQVAAPMDYVALFAWRKSLTPDDVRVQYDPFTEAGINLGDLDYGDIAATQTMQKTSSCIMVGMVDGARVSKGYSGQRATFTCHGRDLTKIFEINYVQIPDASLAGQGGAGPTTQAPGFFGLASIAISRANSGPVLIRAVLDLLVTKDLNALKVLNQGVGYTPPDDVKKAYAAFGYPWRNFITTNLMNDSYQPLTSQNYPPYTPQMGSVWTGLLELRNPPISRLMVTETGALIYDDSYVAWTQAPYITVDPSSVRDFESGFDDADLLTFLSCLPAKMVGTNDIIALSKGSFLPGTGFVSGVAAASSIGQALIQVLGYRYGQFVSMYDITYPDALRRQKYLLQVHNNIFTATATVKGESYYRVGQRYLFNEDTGVAPSTNKVWYVTNVTHSMQFGNDWTTTLQLRFPQEPTTESVLA